MATPAFVAPVDIPQAKDMARPAIVYRPYAGESDLPSIMGLVQSELSEPYVIYTYRYFLHQWYVLL